MKKIFILLFLLLISSSVSAQSYNDAICQNDILCAAVVPDCNEDFVVNWVKNPGPCYLFEFINCAAELAVSAAPVSEELIICQSQNQKLSDITRRLSKRIRKLKHKLATAD